MEKHRWEESEKRREEKRREGKGRGELFLDPKASRMNTSDLCVLHINCITTTCLYICYWSWNTAGVNWFHPALA